jgi:predicted Zn-ribbon and HTH transcriptional regulator
MPARSKSTRGGHFPAPKAESARTALRGELDGAPRTARELSERLSLREKDVLEHVGHLARSLRVEGLELAVTPAECLACGFAFEQRERLTTPSRCPKCKSERVRPPAFSIVAR